MDDFDYLLDSPTDFDEHVMNEDDSSQDGADHVGCVDENEEYMRDDDDGQPDEAQEWHDFDPEC